MVHITKCIFSLEKKNIFIPILKTMISLASYGGFVLDYLIHLGILAHCFSGVYSDNF